MAVAATDSAPAIESEGLTKSYGTVLAVDHLNIRVERGEIFGFLGPNGAGKTTTMRMLLGLVRPSSGSARMLGMDISTNLAQILGPNGLDHRKPNLLSLSLRLGQPPHAGARHCQAR